MAAAKMVSRSTKKATTVAAPRGVFFLSNLALKRRIRRCHSRMLAAEMSAPTASMAALRQPEATSRIKRGNQAQDQRVADGAP